MLNRLTPNQSHFYFLYFSWAAKFILFLSSFFGLNKNHAIAILSAGPRMTHNHALPDKDPLGRVPPNPRWPWTIFQIDPLFATAEYSGYPKTVTDHLKTGPFWSGI